MVSYTSDFGTRQKDDGRVIATCKIAKQAPLTVRRSLREYTALFSRKLRASFNQVTYEMTYSSKYTDTT
eukprot:10837390-Ditylum_brightwellii.AAC.1